MHPLNTNVLKYSDPSTVWGPGVFEEYMLSPFIRSANVCETTHGLPRKEQDR